MNNEIIFKRKNNYFKRKEILEIELIILEYIE